MANNINHFVDNMQISIENTLTHLLHSDNSDGLNAIRHSPYIISDDSYFSNEQTVRLYCIASLKC